ncbi:hypothetical protein ABTX82_27855 [Streptomyces lavendulae]|uniref:hypothetical protein n=1 Tax=Streptomyces lavendulae TaxID=1914 RepID=UPI0033318C1C
MAFSPRIVDVDDLGTWPTALTAHINQLLAFATENRITRDSYDQLDITGWDRLVRETLVGCLVRARHCSRLLDHEAVAIREHGLRPLTPDLVNDRLDQALNGGFLTSQLHGTLTADNATTSTGPRWSGRQNQVCLTLSTASFTHQAPGLLHRYWGGEAIYWKHCDTAPDIMQVLSSMGRPAVVTALIDLSDPKHTLSPELTRVLVGKALGADRADADVFHLSPVPPARIEAIDFPGDSGYDRFPKLRRD